MRPNLNYPDYLKIMAHVNIPTDTQQNFLQAFSKVQASFQVYISGEIFYQMYPIILIKTLETMTSYTQFKLINEHSLK